MGLPYGMRENPFPANPVADLRIARRIAGRRWEEAKKGILRALETCRSGEFVLVTVVGAVGTGKSHLLMHLKNLADSGELEGVSYHYEDLSQAGGVRSLGEIVADLISEALERFQGRFRGAFLDKLVVLADGGSKLAKKGLGLSAWERLRGKTYSELKAEILAGDRDLKPTAFLALEREFELPRDFLIRIWYGEAPSSGDLGGGIRFLRNLSKLLRELELAVVLALDEPSLSEAHRFAYELKGLINAKVPCVGLLISLTDEMAERLAEIDPALQDRLLRGTGKFVLSHPESPEELLDIAISYIGWAGGLLSEEQRKALERFARIAYLDLGFRTLRDFLVLMRSAVESAARANREELTEEDLRTAVEETRPHEVVPGSVSGMRHSDLAEILMGTLSDPNRATKELEKAVRTITRAMFALGMASRWFPRSVIVGTPGGSRPSRRADVFVEIGGEGIVLDVKYTKKDQLTSQMLANVIEMAERGVGVSRAVVITNKPVPRSLATRPGLSVVEFRDSREVADLIHTARLLQGGAKSPEDLREAIEHWAERLRLVPPSSSEAAGAESPREDADQSTRRAEPGKAGEHLGPP